MQHFKAQTDDGRRTSYKEILFQPDVSGQHLRRRGGDSRGGDATQKRACRRGGSGLNRTGAARIERISRRRAGIVGLDLVEGRGVVVRAKAVVMCMGSPCWANGWTGSGAKTNVSPENTGDGLAILLGHGVPVKNLEQWDMCFYNVHPSGIAFSQGIDVSVGDHPENILNSEGDASLLVHFWFTGRLP